MLQAVCLSVHGVDAKSDHSPSRVLMVRQLQLCMFAEGASDDVIFLSSAEPAVMVKAKMLTYPRGLLQQRPVRLGTASSRPKFKQKLAKHKEETCELQECGKILYDKLLSCSLLGRKKKRGKESRGLLISFLTTCVPTRCSLPGSLENNNTF